MMKQIVCFANSRKPDGKCFAGKDIIDKRWIRPISSRQSESLFPKEECVRSNDCSKCTICNPLIPNLLDVVEIELCGYAGRAHQVENYYIGSKKWKKIGILNVKLINQFLDANIQNLWVDGYQASNRKNDRVPVSKSSLLQNSLRLIEVKSLNLEVVFEGARYGNARKKVNGNFYYNGVEYIIPITDVSIEGQYLNLATGIYSLPNHGKRILLCLSMGKDYNGYIYKFISGVMII